MTVRFSISAFGSVKANGSFIFLYLWQKIWPVYFRFKKLNDSLRHRIFKSKIKYDRMTIPDCVVLRLIVAINLSLVIY